MTTKHIELTQALPTETCGKRLDAALVQVFPEYSRSQLVKWLKQGQILVDGHQAKPKDKVKGLEQVTFDCQLTVETDLTPQAGDLNIVYEDDDLLIINKQANWVVHPGAGNPDHTVVNALLYHHQELDKLPRAGIIHRLDKDTTGLLICAKSLKSYTALIKMMQAREISRYYLALVYGELLEDTTIDQPVGRHPTNRTKMAVTAKGKPAVTHVYIDQCYEELTLVECKLESGRTHQIRVHLSHIGHPLVGDQTYYNKNLITQTEKLLEFSFEHCQRQALHAYRLAFNHPITDKTIDVELPLPDDMSSLLEELAPYAFDI